MLFRLRLSTLFLFLLPALIVMIIMSVLNIYALIELSKAHHASELSVQQTVADLNKTVGFIDSVGQQYTVLNDLLIATNDGQVSQSQAYRIQSKMVDDLAQTEQALQAVKQKLSALNIQGLSLDNWQSYFQNFKNFSLMASDIVVIDSTTSKNYINAAQIEYFKFVNESNQLSKQLSVFTDQTFEETSRRIQQSLTSFYFLAFAGVLFAFAIAVIAATQMSKYLQIILSSLRALADFKQDIPKLTDVQKMIGHTKGELNLLGQAVLKFKTTLELNKAEEQRIFKLAYFDELTSLANMQMLHTDLQTQLQKRSLQSPRGVLVKLNINRFKIFNNALGYDFGDKILVAFAQRLAVFANDHSNVYKGSGDEFFIIFHPIEIDPTELESFLTTLTIRIQQLISTPFQIDKETLSLSCNLGLVSFSPLEKITPSEIIRNAMIALHRSKELGSNQAVVYESELSKQVTDTFELYKDLEIALEQNQLEFYLQSQIHPDNHQHRAEALIRWHHPKRGWIRPDIFIKLAEQSHLIIEIDKWMLTQVCRFVKAQSAQGNTLHISVNISGNHFSHPYFIENVTQVFEQTKVNPQQITLELTESVFLEDFGAVVSKMQLLKTLGLRFSIDDFGTGYSSLSYLKRLPMDEIKIDRAFVQNITEDIEDQTLVKAVFEMAETFKLEVVVEGVETHAQEAVLKTYGNPIIQGFLYAKPIAHDEWVQQVLGSANPTGR